LGRRGRVMNVIMKARGSARGVWGGPGGGRHGLGKGCGERWDKTEP
jgi:hypothetical protein